MTDEVAVAAPEVAPAPPTPPAPPAAVQPVTAGPLPAVPVRYDALDKTLEVAQASPEARQYLVDKLIGPELTAMKLREARRDAMLEFNIDKATWEANKILLEGDTPESMMLRAQHFTALRAQVTAPPVPAVPAPAGDTPAVKPPAPDTVSPALPAAAVIPPASGGGALTLEQLRDRALAKAQAESS